MKRKRPKKAPAIATALVAILAAILSLLSDHQSADRDESPRARQEVKGTANQREPQEVSEGELAQFVRFSDGDTLKVIYRGDRETVRLIGIDAPESHRNDRAERMSADTGEPLTSILARGKRASQFASTLLREGESVRLVFDEDKRDRFGRLLAYVYLPNGQMLQEVIIRSGFAKPLTILPNRRHQDLFAKAYREAVHEKRGLWAE